MLDGEALVRELLAVDGLTAATVTVGEVAALEHELGDDAVEDGALVVEGLSAVANALLPVHSARKFSTVLGTAVP